ncbi:MAG: hypothetical protein U0694_04565 [Anaerolineae bacterium]
MLTAHTGITGCFGFYFRFTLLILTLLLLVFSAAMLALGRAQPINPALAGLDD